MNHLKDLNPSQLEAVTHVDGPLLVFAGAGSGKTRVLTRRIANLVLANKIHPLEILAVTFTNKASNEMKSRVAALIGSPIGEMWVSTFHSICLRILRRNARDLGYESNFVIYDTTDSVSTAKRVFSTLGINSKQYDPKMFLGVVDKAKNNYQFPEDLRKSSDMSEDFSSMLADFYQEYQSELKKCNAMDFGDLLCNVVTLFKLEPKILEAYRNTFRYVLVDEYQDTNKVQFLLLEQIAKEHQNICAVGDDDQSIYSFRGASIQNILNFKKDYPNCKVVNLSHNYRSTANIIGAANAVIALNRNREEKKMLPIQGSGDKITCYRAYDDKDEASFVVREIKAQARSGARLNEIAIIYRTNSQSRAVEEELIKGGVPYRIFGGLKFYDRKEIKDLLSYYKLLINPSDNEAFIRVVNMPARGIGSTSIDALIVSANKNNQPLLEYLLDQFKADPKSNVSKKFKGFIELYLELKIQAYKTEQLLLNSELNPDSSNFTGSISQLIKAIAVDSGYLTYLNTQPEDEALSRRENIDELLRVASEVIEDLVRAGIRPKLQDFIDRTVLSTDLENLNTDSIDFKGTVSMMSLHLAKGLEFDSVFLTGIEEGILPHARSIDSIKEIEEERRLFYVGITRAKRRLYISRSSFRRIYGRGQMPSDSSRFLRDIPRALVDDLGSRFFDEFGFQSNRESGRQEQNYFTRSSGVGPANSTKIIRKGAP